MKTLINTGNVSIYIFEDEEVLDITDTNITVGAPPKFIISDCNSTNTTLHSNVTSPEEWCGHKYTYDGAWSAVEGWVSPTQEGQP